MGMGGRTAAGGTPLSGRYNTVVQSVKRRCDMNLALVLDILVATVIVLIAVYLMGGFKR